MRKPLTALALGAVLVAPPLLAPAAAADPHWVFGAGFRVGGFHFSIGYTPVRGHAPTYYYRTSPRFAYRGHRCHDRCHRRGGYVYHHQTCPLVLHHLGLYRVEPWRVLSHHAPHYDRYYGAHRHYDLDRGHDRRHHRFDRHHDRFDRRHDRFDRRHHRFDRRHDRFDRRHKRFDRRHDRRRHDHRRDRFDRHDRRGRDDDDHGRRGRHRGRSGHGHD